MTTWSPAPRIDIADAHAQTHPPYDLEAPAVRSWEAAEGRLYPLITVDAVLYEEAVTLVREAADVLRIRCADVTQLINVDSSAVLASLASAPGWTERGLDPATVFDAARAFRWRELTP